ncbi:MAG: Rieske (2Fe-2S) protein [Nocardioides sp.]|nr:Rieske (2Fe-2S) protein [Nocardioides sp.]
MATPGLSRRRALTGAAGLGVGLPVLAACSDNEPTSASDPYGANAPSTPSSPSTSGAGDETPTADAALASTSDIPVGGGVVFADAGVVVTQPEAGQFKGFGVVCTHSGCPVDKVTETINCPCHGSKFSIVDGTPQSGPATGPLGTVELTVEGDQISLT